MVSEAMIPHPNPSPLLRAKAQVLPTNAICVNRHAQRAILPFIVGRGTVAYREASYG